MSLVQAAGHREAVSQASDCSFNVCHAQYSINGKYNPLPAAQQPSLLTHRPDSSSVLTSQSDQRHRSYTARLEGICLLAYMTVRHTATPPPLCYSGDLLKAIRTTYLLKVFHQSNKRPSTAERCPCCLSKPQLEEAFDTQKHYSYLPQTADEDEAEQPCMAQALTLSLLLPPWKGLY